MKVCMVLQNQYSKIGHAIARVLKERHGVTEFCAYVISPFAQEFLAAQRDIRYEPMLVDHQLHARAWQEPLDVQYIERFERVYGPPPLWHYLYADRKLMMSIGPKEETTTEVDALYSHEDLMRTFQVRAKAIEEMLTRERPDFILFFAIGTLAHLILYHVAKKMGIRALNIDFPRIANRVCISEDYRRLTGVDAIAEQFRHDGMHDTPFHKEADALLQRFRATGTLDLEYFIFAVEEMRSQTAFPRRITRSLAFFPKLCARSFRYRGLFTYGENEIGPLNFLKYKLRQRARIWRGIADLTARPDLQVPYLFYPLHYEPELATLLLSPYYFDQIQLVGALARSLPLHWKLYVKEHPTMQGRRARSFYRALLRFPNVVLLDPHISTFTLLRSAKLVATITGTAGWEATLLGKPVLTFGEVFYNSLSTVRRAHDLEALPALIKQTIVRYAPDEGEIRNFFAAVLCDSVPFDFFALWYENDIEKLVGHTQIHGLCARIASAARGAL